MLIDWTDEFDRWYSCLEEDSARGDAEAQMVFDLVDTELGMLERLEGVPVEESASIKRVRQSRKYEVWRVAHPFKAGFAVRIIVWFPTDQTAVVALFGNNKAQMGDVFYDSVGSRADQAIENYQRRIAAEQHKHQEQDQQGTNGTEES